MLRLLVVGSTHLTDRLIEAIAADPRRQYGVIGVVGPLGGSAEPRPRYRVLGTLADLDGLVATLLPDVIAVTLAERRVSLPFKALLDYRLRLGIAIEDGVVMYERLTGAVAVDTLTPSSLIFSDDLGGSPGYRAWARAISVVVACAGLIALAPLLLLIAVAVALDSDGPVIFSQPRVGRLGTPFTLRKFRTMRASGDDTSEWGAGTAGRITRVGRWLRKFRLDELPQLVNVLRGEMNLVGPRPHPMSNLPTLQLLTRNLCDVTGIEVPYYTLRTLVSPGITGWAQIRYGYANNVDGEIEKLCYDLYYVKHVSLRLDLRILIGTARAALRGFDSGPMAVGTTGRSAA